jgi:predicted ATPase
MSQKKSMEIVIEDVRCFQDRHVIPLKPMTLLLGENSAGKSTFLAVIASVFNNQGFPFSPSFNLPPYELGSYENIASRQSIQGGTAKKFRIGYNISDDEKNTKKEVLATYKGKMGQVTLSEFQVKTAKVDFSININKNEVQGQLEILTGKNNKFKTIPIATTLPDLPMANYGHLMSGIILSIVSQKSPPVKNATSLMMQLFETVGSTTFPFADVRSIAPIRTKPRRTYDQFNEDYHPEGEHVPLKLARVLESLEDDKLKGRVQNWLADFGRESGLFDEVLIERIGTEPSSPFRLNVRLGGLSLSLFDVGYGVSQSLPIIAQTILSKETGMLLMQQPEVHLHPRAQAAFGTFFASLAKSKHLHFAIETHSDYLVDRLRQEVANGKLDHDDIAILFFEKKNGGTKVHSLLLDEQGNIVNPPKHYRDFFLKEEIRLLSRGAV